MKPLTIQDNLEYKLLQELLWNDRSGNRDGYCRYDRHNTNNHEDTKWEVFKFLKQNGFKVWTEIRFKNLKGRADIVAISPIRGIIIEIVKTEKEKSIQEKRKKYPKGFEFIVVDSNNFKKEEFKI